MVNKRMEGRMEGIEREMGSVKEDVNIVKEDVGSIKEYLLELREWIKLKEERDGSVNRGKDKVESSGTQGSNEDLNRNQSNQSKSNENGGEDRKVRKLELPVFYGEDPHGWLFRADRYFQVNKFVEEEKLEAAAVCMEGRALNWFQWVESRVPFSDWRSFKKAVIDRFRPSYKGSAFESLVTLKQTTSVTDYREQFELLSAPMQEVEEELLMGTFTSGLKEEIRAELRLVQPKNLFELMDQAHRIEERNRGRITFPHYQFL